MSQAITLLLPVVIFIYAELVHGLGLCTNVHESNLSNMCVHAVCSEI